VHNKLVNLMVAGSYTSKGTNISVWRAIIQYVSRYVPSPSSSQCSRSSRLG